MSNGFGVEPGPTGYFSASGPVSGNAFYYTRRPPIQQINAMDEKRLLWASRRGMLELDLILIPFVEQVYPQLALRDQQLYQELLACEDQDIFTWLLRSVLPQEQAMRRIVDIILASRKP